MKTSQAGEAFYYEKLLRVFLLTLLTALCLCTFASSEVISGECGAEGSNVTWTLDAESGVLTISGRGCTVEYGV